MKKTLFILCALLLTAVGASAQGSWTAPTLPTGSTLSSGGKYYLYNTEAEQFMGQVHLLWGTEAGFTDSGLLVTLDSSGSAYTINTTSGYVFFDGTYLYIDGKSADSFTFAAVGDGTYTIQTASSGYLGYSGTAEIKTTLTSSDTGIYWELIAGDANFDIDLYHALVILYNTLVHAESYGMTAESSNAYESAGETYTSGTATVDEVMVAVAALEEAMEAYASEEDPDDVTYAYITNPSFDSYDENTFTGWTNTGMTSQATNIFVNGNGGITISVYPEKWVESTSSLDNAKISQTLADLPVGTYRLEADAIAVKQTTESPAVTGVNLYASSLTTSMTSVSTPDGLPAHYTVNFEVAAEGTSVEIGFEVISTNANWVAVDNFRLYYLSSAATELKDTDSDYKKDGTATIYGHKYDVKSDNMVQNHSFELGFTGWTNASDFTTEITSEKFELRSDGAQDGKVYLVGITSESASSSGSLGKAWAIESGKTYYFSYYVKGLGEATDGGYLITSLGNDKGTESVSLNTPTVTSEWQKIEVLFTNTNYNYVQVKFRWLDTLWGFDNFQLYEVEPAEDVLEEVVDDSEYKTGDEVTVTVEGEDITYIVVSDNMFVNGGFNADMYGWTEAGYYVAADPANFEVKEEGGFNNGAYLVDASAGVSSVKTPSQAIAVEEGKTYLFIGYTSGTTPEGGERYSALFEMSDATTEASHTEGDGDAGTSYSNTIIQLEWDNAGDGLNGWTKTEGVFTVPAADEEGTYSYVGMRMGWSEGSYDGFQLYEVEAVASEVTWTMTTANWGTLILPFAVETVPDGLTMYAGDALSLDEESSTITVSTAAGTIAANTPYLVSGNVTADTQYTFKGTPEEATEGLTAGLLTGTFVDMDYNALAAVETSTSSTVYLLQNHTEGDGVAFYPVVTTGESSAATLTPYHCYLTTSSGKGGVRGFISFPNTDGEATAIVAVESAEAEGNGAIYDLSGRKVSKAVKGVYIQNGKKVLVK